MRRIIIAAAFILTALTGCGGDDDPKCIAWHEEAITIPAHTETRIKIIPITGISYDGNISVMGQKTGDLEIVFVPEETKVQRTCTEYEATP